MRTWEQADRLPTWLWLILPCGLAVVCLAVGFIDPKFYDLYLETEFGVVKNLTALLLLFALLLAARSLRIEIPKPRRWYLAWLALFIAVSFLFLGEELSWCQHFIGWKAHGVFTARGQQETNIHNLHPFMAQAPRAIVVVVVLFAGVLLPVAGLGRWLARRLPEPEDFWLWIQPSKACALGAAMVLVIKLPKRIYRWLGLEDQYWPGINDNELLELFLAYFFFLYALTLYRRLKHVPPPP